MSSRARDRGTSRRKKVAVPEQTRLSGLGTKSNLDMSSRAPHCSKEMEKNSIPSRT